MAETTVPGDARTFDTAQPFTSLTSSAALWTLAVGRMVSVCWPIAGTPRAEAAVMFSVSGLVANDSGLPEATVVLKLQPTLVTLTMTEVAATPIPAEIVPVAVPPAAKIAAAPARLPVPALKVALIAPVAVPATAEIDRPVTITDSTLAVSEPAILTVSTLPAMLAVAPSEPVERAVLGVPTKLTLVAGPEKGAIVTVNEPAVLVGIDAIACSLNVKVALVAEVPPTGTLPAEPTVTAARAAGATAVARREAISPALMPMPNAFFLIFKSSFLQLRLPW